MYRYNKDADISNFWIAPDKELYYIPVHKNASTKFVNILKKNDWSNITSEFSNLNAIDLPNKSFCILRDPYQRYLSGLTEFIKICTLPPDVLNNIEIMDNGLLWAELIHESILKNKTFGYKVLKLMFSTIDNFEIDWHTRLQIYYIKNYNNTKTTFFWLDENIETNLQTFLKNSGYIIDIDISKINDSETNGHYIHQFVKNFFDADENKELQKNLFQYLEPDYKLINSINFYAR